ncbi:MAG: polyprenyl synthetase family protein [Lachnospiraceae bacterium]|nr:polyprenyl synthetase family protein [Lachnospiraceae bacterium]
MSNDFYEVLNNKVAHVEDVLSRKGVLREEGYQHTVIEAMNYALMGGGKRLRPLIMQEVYSMFGGDDADIIECFMTALEMIHTYSLVHDDLPAMDNDDYRRGRKTCHIVYGEDMAILTGDALLNRAFEVALNCSLNKSPEKSVCILKALKLMASKSGIYGMVGGQVFDVESENLKKANTLEEILFIHRLKTSALLQIAFMAGGILAGAPEKDIELLSIIGENVGVAFQIKDDILDVTSTQEVLGKPIGSDEKNNKTTYVNLVGLEQSEEDVKKYSEIAIDSYDLLSKKNEFLRELIISLVSREK